jgi:hypothetical protein
MTSRNGRRDLKISALRSRRATAFTLLAGLLGACFHCPAQANSAMSWIPAYEVKDSADGLLTNLGGGRTATHTLSRIALQFWIPADEDLALDKWVSEADVRRLAAVARQKQPSGAFGRF